MPEVPVEATCDVCGKKTRFPARCGGQERTCLNCGAPLLIPKLTKESEIETEAPLRPRSARKITETKNSCTACGRVWYYGKADSLEQTGAAMENLGKDMMCCSGCAPAALIPDKEVADLDRCPDCGSRAVVSEKVTHEVE